MSQNSDILFQRLFAVNIFFPPSLRSCGNYSCSTVLSSRSVVDYASSCWFSTTKALQKQIESIQKKFLQSIRPSGDNLEEMHDANFEQYHQYLREVDWKPLGERRCENILLTAFKIWKGLFAGRDQIMLWELNNVDKNQKPSKALEAVTMQSHWLPRRSSFSTRQ